MYKFSALAFICLFLSSTTLAQERLAFLYMSYSATSTNCNLFERGKGIKKSYFEFPAEKTNDKSYCVSSLKKAEFDQHFKFCAISGFNNKFDGNGACYFQENELGYEFVSGVPKHDKLSLHQCNFVCMTKTDGNKTN